MPDLIPQPTPAISEAPRSQVSLDEIAQPDKELARNMDAAGGALMDAVAVPLAKQQAANDLIKQKVTSNADGSVNVVDPASAPLLWGDAGVAYRDAVTAGTIAQHANDVSQKLAEFHAKYPTDPAGFKTASDTYLAGRTASIGGVVGEAVQREGAQIQTQHFNAITNASAANAVENQKTAILNNIDDQKNTAIALARQNGTGTPEFQQAVTKLNAAYDALGGNPLFKTPSDQIALEKKNTGALLDGEAMVGAVDDTFNKKGKAAAQQVLQTAILNNPNMREVDRTRLYTQGMARLAYLTNDAKANVDANHQAVTELEKTLADNKISPDDPAIGMAIGQSIKIGDTEGAQRVTAAAAVARHFRGVNSMPDPIKSEVLGIPGTNGNDPINTAIPPEGRALLKTIGTTESANRYNVRYSGQGYKTFQDFSDHPRIGETITSGPDAGKTSAAAGYYQFIPTTWDAEKQKLGLKDFSPANQDAAAWDLAQTTYKQQTGKDLLSTLKSGQTADVLPALSGQWSSLPGGRQPAGRYMAPSANGGPGFTAEDAQRNPFLLSAYVRTLAADPETRVQSAKQTAASMIKGLDNGFLFSPQSYAEVKQAAALYPDKLGAIADEIDGRLAGQKIANLPQEQRDQLMASYKAAVQGQDVHQINIANAALAQVERQNANMREHPLNEGAARGWTQAPAPIDPSIPESIAPALVQRAGLSARIGTMNHMPPPPLLDKDDMPKLQSALQGQNGAAVLGSIAQTLKPDEMAPLLNEEAFRSGVTGMSRSGDPAKMNAAYSFMDTLQKQNPLQFDKQFPDGLKDLRAWQSNLAFYPPDEAAKRIMNAYDPAQAAGREAAEKVADTALKNVSPSNVVSKFSTSWLGSNASAPAAQQAGIAAGALKADYDQNYKDGFVLTGDPTAADKFAMEKLSNKYAVSLTNGGRVTAYAPEKYYPQVGGSYDWMAEQLDAAVAGKLGVDRMPPGDLGEAVEPASLALKDDSRADRQYAAQRAIVSDDGTERDIAAGRPPSYQVIIRDPNGRWSTMMGQGGVTQRFRFDPAAPFAKRAAGAEQTRAFLAQPYNQAVPGL